MFLLLLICAAQKKLNTLVIKRVKPMALANIKSTQNTRAKYRVNRMPVLIRNPGSGNSHMKRASKKRWVLKYTGERQAIKIRDKI
jgi:hypothetical protein